MQQCQGYPVICGTAGLAVASCNEIFLLCYFILSLSMLIKNFPRDKKIKVISYLLVLQRRINQYNKRVYVLHPPDSSPALASTAVWANDDLADPDPCWELGHCRLTWNPRFNQSASLIGLIHSQLFITLTSGPLVNFHKCLLSALPYLFTPDSSFQVRSLRM